jgi:hypothetical protein
MDSEIKTINNMIDEKEYKHKVKLEKFGNMLNSIDENLEDVVFIQCQECENLAGLFFGIIQVNKVICIDCKKKQD